MCVTWDLADGVRQWGQQQEGGGLSSGMSSGCLLRAQLGVLLGATWSLEIRCYAQK